MFVYSTIYVTGRVSIFLLAGVCRRRRLLSSVMQPASGLGEWAVGRLTQSSNQCHYSYFPGLLQKTVKNIFFHKVVPGILVCVPFPRSTLVHTALICMFLTNCTVGQYGYVTLGWCLVLYDIQNNILKAVDLWGNYCSTNLAAFLSSYVYMSAFDYCVCS